MQEGAVKENRAEELPMEVKQPAKAELAPVKYIESTVINFDFDSYKIHEQQKARLERILGKLKSTNTNYLIKVTGYTDNTGSQIYNDALAMKRAQIIQDYLKKNEVPLQYLALDAKGKCCYLNDNATEDDRYQNRRAEIIYMNEFFVVDFDKDNLSKIMEELSLHHLDKKFIVFQNINAAQDDQVKQVNTTTQALKANFLELEGVQKASFTYGEKQVVVAIAGSHPVLMDELPQEEMYGNAPQEIIKHNGRYVIKDKVSRLKPVMRSETEVARVLALKAEKKPMKPRAKTTNESELAKRIERNLGFHIDDKILRTLDEIN